MATNRPALRFTATFNTTNGSVDMSWVSSKGRGQAAHEAVDHLDSTLGHRGRAACDLSTLSCIGLAA